LFFLQTGWDANEMFNINAEKFNIKSDYDPNLTQYTWVLLICITFYNHMVCN